MSHTIRSIRALLYAAIAIGALAASCGDDDDAADAGDDSGSDTDTDTDTDSDTDPGPDVVVVTVTVPADFDAVPDQLVAYFHELYPPGGEAAAVAGTFSSPAIGPEIPFELETDHAGLSGAYYLWIVLFVEGGGAGGNPVLGVDWIGGSPVPLTLGPGEGTNDLGTIQLDLYL
jgi:hypothetical protein